MNYQPPKRIFEDTGYVDPENSYHVHIENVVNRHNQDLKTMVDHGRYFSIFAPRQSGKTTFFMTFAKELEKDPKYIFILMSFENYVNYSLQKFYNTVFSKLINEQVSVNNQKKKIFISYCNKDKDWLMIIMNYLKGLEYENINIWFDKKIKTGEQWNPAIADAIQTSHMTICLISQNYLNSDFIRTREVPGILNKQREGMIVFPVLIKNCTWKVITWLKNLQIIPNDSIPLEKLSKDEQENRLIKLIDHVHEAFNKGD